MHIVRVNYRTRANKAAPIPNAPAAAALAMLPAADEAEVVGFAVVEVPAVAEVEGLTVVGALVVPTGVVVAGVVTGVVAVEAPVVEVVATPVVDVAGPLVVPVLAVKQEVSVPGWTVKAPDCARVPVLSRRSKPSEVPAVMLTFQVS